MKKFKNKIMAGLLVVALASNIYAVDTQQQEGNPIATLEMENNIADDQGQTEDEPTIEGDIAEKQNIKDQVDDALQVFEVSGMSNIYPNLKRRDKKSWDKIVNENNYIQGEEGTTYQLAGVYELGEGQYYLVGWGEDEEDIAKGIFQLVLTQEEKQFFVTYSEYPSEDILTSEEVALYKKEEQVESNVAIKYDQVSKLNNVDEYVGYLDEAIEKVDQEGINDSAKSEVTQYVQHAIEELSSESMKAEDNTIQVDKSLLEQMKDSLAEAKNEFEGLLNDKDISFNKDLNTVLKLQTQQVNFKKPVFIQLPDSFEDLGEVSGLRILLADESYIYIDSKDFEALAGMQIKVERLKDKKTYEVTFLTLEDEVVPQLEQTITFAFPAKDEFTTVLAHYAEEPQNWGGQFDPSTRTIAFGTKYSGQYKIVDNTVKIKDIGDLSKKQQSAIKFMVSKGYFTLENERFNPESTFTRYEFAEALVKMFFALDTSLTTTMKDVPVDSPYYPYVASGETYEIIKGYEDGTFKGEVNILREQVLSLCARTIADQKGYVYPEKIEDYINFADTEEIGKWAMNDIALAVQSGLVTSGGKLAPKAEITRAESAEILYQLFMLLYETTPGDIVEVNVAQKTYSIVGVILLALLAIWWIRRFIKRNKVILMMLVCTMAIILTLIIGFKGGF